MTSRVHVNARIGAKGVEWMDRLAEDTTTAGIETNRSDVLRAALVVARQNEDNVKAILRARI